MGVDEWVAVGLPLEFSFPESLRPEERMMLKLNVKTR